MIDLQSVVDGIDAMACIVSVEDLGNGKSGKYRIVTGNKAYVGSIENPAPGTAMLTDKFIPNQEYTKYLTRDLNFEDFCYRAAVQKKCLHAYVHPDRLPAWFNMTFLPIGQKEDNLCYCMYIMEINFEPSSKRMSNISGDMASAVLETCIMLRGTTNFNKTMKDVIKEIRELCEAEYCCVLTMDIFAHRCETLSEDFSSNSKLLPMDYYLDDKFYDIAQSWEETISGSNCIIVKNEQDMEVIKERNPIWYKSLMIAGAKTLVLFPLRSRNQLLGYIWAMNFNAENTVKIKETLELTTFILGSELGNYMLLDRLKILSSKDMLTGVMNRNEMNNYVEDLSTGKEAAGSSVGVVFADLNGLKTINDEEGHNAGDTLLKNAADALRQVFNEHDIFRAGGDEFSIIKTGITEEELNQKIQDVRDASKKYDKVIFAIGGALENDAKNVRSALRHADERMYEDKKKFYAEHPERKMR